MPVNCVDLDGKEPKSSVIVKSNYEKDGSIYKLTKSETKSVWPIQYSNQVTINGKNYNANSKKSTFGRDNAPNRKEGNFTGVTEISKESIATLMAYGLDVIKKGGGDITNVFKAESGTKAKLDYKYKAYEVLNISENNLLNINGTLYNPNEAGNYLWGMLYEYAGEVTNFKGGFYNPALAADFKTIKDQKRVDEANEQYAIKVGTKQGDVYSDDKQFNKLVKEKISNETKANFTASTQ